VLSVYVLGGKESSGAESNTQYAKRNTEKNFRGAEHFNALFFQPLESQCFKRSFDIFFQCQGAAAKIVGLCP